MSSEASETAPEAPKDKPPPLPPAQRLPPELIETIASFLNARELMCFETACAKWREVCVVHTSLWIRHLEQLWHKTGYSQNVPALVPLTVRIKATFGVAQMRRALLLYDTTGLVEKSDFVSLLASRILFGRLCSAADRRPSGYVFPSWCKHVNDGKRAWLFGLRETRRLVPLDSELFSFSWRLSYKRNPEHGPFGVQFFSNHEMSCESHGEQRFSFRIVSGTDGGFLQVENFPTHRIYRGPDGAWIWENEHVICHQVVESITTESATAPLPML